MAGFKPMRGLVPRAAWGARLATCSTPIPPKDLIGMAVHYTAANADEQSDHRNCAGRVREVQRFHMDTRGWCDIAYNFVVCKHGAIFVGRGWHLRSAAQGTNDGNAHYLAVCFLGDDTAGRDDVTVKGRRAFRRVFKRFGERFGHAPQLKPHSYFHPTGCPGDELRHFIANA